MRYMSIYKTVERETPPTQQEMAAMNALIEDTIKSGELIETGGLLPSARGFRVRRAKGKVVVTDGPFTESKEVVGGYAILEATVEGACYGDDKALSRGRRRGRV